MEKGSTNVWKTCENFVVPVATPPVQDFRCRNSIERLLLQTLDAPRSIAPVAKKLVDWSDLFKVRIGSSVFINALLIHEASMKNACVSLGSSL